VAGGLTIAQAQSVILAGGASPANIVWVVAGAVSLGTTSAFEGIILGATSITLQTGSSINGRLLAQTDVALQVATVTEPITLSIVPPPTSTVTTPTSSATPPTMALPAYQSADNNNSRSRIKHLAGRERESLEDVGRKAFKCVGKGPQLAPQSGEDTQTRRGPRSRGHPETMERERTRTRTTVRTRPRLEDVGRKWGTKRTAIQKKAQRRRKLPDLPEFLVNQESGTDIQELGYTRS
ncbi:hypothetical protein FIBSPDRAFT_906107, partial [Athelia psychrophila]